MDHIKNSRVILRAALYSTIEINQTYVVPTSKLHSLRMPKYSDFDFYVSHIKSGTLYQCLAYVYDI